MYISLRVTEWPLQLAAPLKLFSLRWWGIIVKVSQPFGCDWLSLSGSRGFLDSSPLRSIYQASYSYLVVSQPGPGFLWNLSVCVYVLKSAGENEWFRVEDRLNLTGLKHTHTKVADPDSKCWYVFSHLGTQLVFHSFFTRVIFATRDSAVTHFLNFTGQLE